MGVVPEGHQGREQFLENSWVYKIDFLVHRVQYAIRTRGGGGGGLLKASLISSSVRGGAEVSRDSRLLGGRGAFG